MASSTFLLGHGRTGCGVTQHFPHSVPVEAVAEMFNWKAVEVPMFVKHNAMEYLVPGKKALLRSDLGIVLGTPSAKYAPHQYQDSLLAGLTRILGGGLAIDAAGMTGYGAKAWVSVSLADTVTTPEGVEFLPRLFALGSHDSTIASTYKRSALNMICNNMLGMLHRDKGSEAHGFAAVKVRHTANSILRLESAQEALGILANIEDEFAAQVRMLCAEEVTRAQWDLFVKSHVPVPTEAGRGQTLATTTIEQLQAMYLNDERCAPWAGTLYGVVQTVNTHNRHVATVRGAERSERNQERDMTTYWDDLDSATVASYRRAMQTA